MSINISKRFKIFRFLNVNIASIAIACIVLVGKKMLGILYNII